MEHIKFAAIKFKILEKTKQGFGYVQLNNKWYK
jgi:hypothetical protein